MVRYNASFFIWAARGLGFQLNGEGRHEMFDGSVVFRSIFGIDAQVCSFVYRLGQLKAKGISPKHMLWGLLLAKEYGTESSYAAKLHTTRKTFRKRSFQSLQTIASLLPKVVCLHIIRTTILFIWILT